MCETLQGDTRCSYPYTPTGGVPFLPNARTRASLRKYVCSLCIQTGLDPLTLPSVLDTIDAKESVLSEAEVRTLILETDAMYKRLRERKQMRQAEAAQDYAERNARADALQARLNAAKGVRGGRKKSKRSKRSKRTRRHKKKYF